MAVTITITSGTMKLSGVTGLASDVFLTASNGNFSKDQNNEYRLYDKIYGREYNIGDSSNVNGGISDAALEALLSGFFSNSPAGSVSSVFGRTGVVVAAGGDYAASQVSNDSGVDGTNVDDALNNLAFHDYAESEAESSTSLTTYQPKLQHTTPLLSASDYMIRWSGERVNSVKDNNTMVEVDLDSGTILAEFSKSNTKATDEWLPFSGFKKVTLTAATHTVDINYKAVAGTAKIRRVRIEITKIS